LVCFPVFRLVSALVLFALGFIFDSRMSAAWKYFIKANKDEAKCVECKSIILTKGGSTKGLFVHLLTKHKIDLKSKTPLSSNSDGVNSKPAKRAADGQLLTSTATSSKSAAASEELHLNSNSNCNVLNAASGSQLGPQVSSSSFHCKKRLVSLFP